MKQELLNDHHYYTKREAADYLRMSVRSIDSIPTQQLPRYKPGGNSGKVYFSRADLDRWMMTRKSCGNLDEIVNQALASLRTKKPS